MPAPVRMGPPYALRRAGLIRLLSQFRLPESLAMPDETSCGDPGSRNSTRRFTKLLRSPNDGRLRWEWKLITFSTTRILVFRVIHKARFRWGVMGMLFSRTRQVISPIT